MTSNGYDSVEKVEHLRGNEAKVTVTSAGSAIIEIRNLPAQAVAAVEIARQLRERGWETIFVAARMPKWFATLYPEVARETQVIADKKINKKKIFHSVIKVAIAAAQLALFKPAKSARLHEFSLRDVQVGDLILDSAIRSGGAQMSLVRRWAWIIRSAVLAEQVLRSIEALCRLRNPELIVVSSRSYASLHGLLSRYGKERGLKVLNCAPAFISFTTRDPNQFRLRTSPRPDAQDFVANARTDAAIREKIKNYIEERFSVSSVNKDFRRGTTPRDTNRKQELEYAQNCLAHLREQSEKPIIYLAPHVFADAVHMEGPQLFRDYLDWFVRTIRAVQSLPGATWVTKSHPAAADYGELSLIRDMLRKHDKADRVLQLDDATPPAEIMAAANAVVTVRGTVGMEFGAHGKIVLLAGGARYSHLGFSISPESKEEYFRSLAALADSSSIRVDAFAAKAALYYFETQLIAARMPGSAFSVDAHDLLADDWAKIATELESVRANGTDPFLRRITDTLDADPQQIIYE